MDEQINILAELIKAQKALDAAISAILNPPKIKEKFPDIPKLVMSHCIAYYEITVKEFKSGSRKREHVFARYIFFRLAKETSRKTLSLADLGSYVGKDHSSVLHGFKELKNAELTNDNLWLDFLNVRANVTQSLNKFVFDQIEEDKPKEIDE